MSIVIVRSSSEKFVFHSHRLNGSTTRSGRIIILVSNFLDANRLHG